MAIESDPRHPLAERGRRRERAQPARRPAHEQDAALVEVIEQRSQIGPQRGQAGAGREVAVPCPRAVDGEEPHACLPRDGVGRTSEAGVGCSVQVDDRRAGGIADVVVGQEAPIGQAQRARTHKRSVRALATLPSTRSCRPQGEPRAALFVREDPQRRPRRARRSREDDARRGAPAPSRRHQPPRTRRGRQHGQRPRPRGAASGDLALARRHAVRVEGPQGQPGRHAWLRRLPRRRARRAARRRPGRVRGERGGRRRGADRGDLARGQPTRCAEDDLHQQARPRTRELRTHARPAPRSARRGGGPARAPHRRRGGVQGHRRPPHRHRPPLRGRRPAHRADPRRDGGPRAPGARQPRRGHRGGRRRPARAVPRRRGARPRGARARPHPRHRDGQRVPRGVRLGHGRGRHRSARGSARGDRSPARRPTHHRPGRRHRGRGAGRSGRATARRRVQDHRRPVRGPGLPAQGALRARSATTTTS